MMARLSRLSSSASLMPRRLSNRWAAVRSVLAEQRRQAEEQRGTRRRLSTLKKLARVIATGESGELGEPGELGESRECRFLFKCCLLRVQ